MCKYIINYTTLNDIPDNFQFNGYIIAIIIALWKHVTITLVIVADNG